MDPFLLKCAAIVGLPRLLAVRGKEELGQCFEYDLCFTIDDDGAAGVDPGKVLGEQASLTIGEDAMQISGRVAEVELLEDVPFAIFRVRLVPTLWFLRLSAHNRVFVDRSIPDILREVLEQAGLLPDEFDLRLTRAYKAREHVCQYQESDLAFIERWMEREGMYYFFDHCGMGKLVICDAPGHAPIRTAPVAYHPMAVVDGSPGESFDAFRASGTAVPKQVAESDHNYLTPGTKIRSAVDVSPELAVRVEAWGDNEADEGGARRLAELRAERELCQRRRYFAAGQAIGIHAGFTFSLDRHPVDELNREYLAVRVVLRGQHTGLDARVVPFFSPEETAEMGRDVVRIEVEAIASDIPFRPPQRTAWPRVSGLEVGIVDGPADHDHAQLDQHGRYLVKLKMDEHPSPAGRASMRIRMLQPHGGKQEGFHLPLRKNTEVLVAFVGGDPDRPIIAAAVPNAHTPSPVTSANRSQNVLVTGGFSRVEMEDTEGGEYIDVSTPPGKTYLHLGAHAGLGDHNIVLSTGGDSLLRTGGNRDLMTGGDQTEDVQGSLTESYHANQSTHVASSLEESIDGGVTQTIHAGHAQTITGGLTQDVQGGEERSVAGGTTETIYGSRTQTIVGSTTETISSTQAQTISGGAAITSTGTFTVKADGGITLRTDGVMNMMSSTWLMNAAGGQINVDDHFLSIATENVKSFNILSQPNLINATASALNIGIVGARFDRVARKVEGSVVAISNDGTKLEGGSEKKVFAAVSVMAGFLMFV
ncbi:type VI secretion system tip protein TssI/VgrG [Sorangium sp. So ce429]